MRTRLLLCFAISSCFSACTSTKNWQGTANSQVARAEFDELTGKQTFTLHVPDNNTYLHYQFNETAGELEASIRSATESVFNKKIDSSEASSIHLVNQKGALYKVTVKGKHASGAFDVRFAPSAK